MGTNVIIVAISSVTAIVVAAFTYYAAKQREREAEWRRENLLITRITLRLWQKRLGSMFPKTHVHVIASRSIPSDYSLLKT